MAIVETPDGDILISGGANRGTIWRSDARGGAAGTPLVELDVPVFNMAFDKEGRLWATTGGGALLRLDPDTGAVLGSFGQDRKSTRLKSSPQCAPRFPYSA